MTSLYIFGALFMCQLVALAVMEYVLNWKKL